MLNELDREFLKQQAAALGIKPVTRTEFARMAEIILSLDNELAERESYESERRRGEDN